MKNGESNQPCWVSQVVLGIKNLPAKAGDITVMGSIAGLERSPGGGHGSPLQYSCLENPMEGEAWQATVHKGCKELDMTEKNLHEIGRAHV